MGVGIVVGPGVEVAVGVGVDVGPGHEQSVSSVQSRLRQRPEEQIKLLLH